jgi:hypothetical protein
MTPTRIAMLAVCLVLLLFVLAGCTTAPQLQPVRVPIPVACQQNVPERPVMPTEHLPLQPTLHDFVKASQAEIERREGYEGKLRAALVACTASNSISMIGLLDAMP